MLKKSFVALAAAAVLAAFAAVADPTPAAAQGMHRPPMPRMHAPGPRMMPMHGGPRIGAFHHPRPAPVFRPAPRHHHVRPWVGPAIGFYSTGVYGLYGGYEECRIVRKRVRVLTDDGWRLRWRKVRYCY
ncbi:MAG: hypothetical protein OEL76_09220 [Siculibacillus sp.]|nr:hypothetical protein [Siculibacillus sp.]